ncbi:MAG: hypothetical protein M3Q80_02140 [bacterium]|nr:hypothetical protein [bacterium]
MKHLTTAIFVSRDAAEKAINIIHNKLAVPNEDISFIYRNTEGEVREVDASKISTSTPVEGAKSGAAVGGTIGAVAGLAAVAGLIPVIGPIFAAGALTTALGLTGAIGTTAAGAITGAVAGGLVGALVNLGVGKEHAKRYEDLVMAGDVLVSVYSPEGSGVSELLHESGAIEVNTYTPIV